MTNLKINLNDSSKPEDFQFRTKYSDLHRFYQIRSHNFIVNILLIIQIVSTCLMLFNLPFMVQGSLNDSYMTKSDEVHRHNELFSGNAQDIDSDFVDLTLQRLKRRLSSEPQTKILTNEAITVICQKNGFVERFKALIDYKLRYCDIFNALSVIYTFMISDSDVVNITKIATFPFLTASISTTDEYINRIPSQIILIQQDGNIVSVIPSVQILIQKHFSSGRSCQSLLQSMIDVENQTIQEVKLFLKTLRKNRCIRFMTEEQEKNISLVEDICNQCGDAYKQWLCTQKFDLYASIVLPQQRRRGRHRNAPDASSTAPWTDTTTTSLRKHRAAHIGFKSCPTWCSQVETICPYFTPQNSNGGEPAFLCDESHYHHSARYRLKDITECGADLPWSYCCYSKQLLDELQLKPDNPFLQFNISNLSSHKLSGQSCSEKQKICLVKLTKTIYTIIQKSNATSNGTSWHSERFPTVNSQSTIDSSSISSTSASLHNVTNNALMRSNFYQQTGSRIMAYSISCSVFLYFYTNYFSIYR